MDALLASVRSAAAAGASLADQRALLDAGVDEIAGSGGGGAANMEALRAPLQAALDAEPALPRSIFYLYLLDAAWHASTDADAPRLADLSAAFASSVDPELAREAAPKLAAVLRRMAAFYSSRGAARCSLLPLTMALRKMQRSAPAGSGAGEITPLHPLLFEAALEAQNPRAALPVLDDLLGGGGGGGNFSAAATAAPPEISLAPEVTGVSTRDVLLAFYLGGLLRAARREWDLASAAFALALAVPAAAAPSAVASEAFKRWTLVRVAAGRGGSGGGGASSTSLLGEFPGARSASLAVLRAVKADAAAYVELARAAGRGVSAYAAAAAREGGVPFCLSLPGSAGGGDGSGASAASAAAISAASGDGQLGLLRAAVRGERDRALAALSRVYAALPLRDVLSKAGEEGGPGRRRAAGAGAAAEVAAPPPAVEVEEEEEEAEEAAAALFPTPGGGDEGGEGGGGGEEEAMEEQQQQQEGGDAAAAAAPATAAAADVSQQPPRSSSRRGQPSPSSRRATAEARAAALAAAKAASASFEASLLPAGLVSSKGGSGEEEEEEEEEEAERALWALADAALAAAATASLSSSSSVSSFELPAMAHSTLIRIDAVARTVSFESEAAAAAAAAAAAKSGSSPAAVAASAASPLTLQRLRRALDAANELTARVRAAAQTARTDPEMVLRAAERQRGASAAAEEAAAARARAREEAEREREWEAGAGGGGGGDVDFAVA